MAVNLTWSLTNGGTSVTEIDHGSTSNNSATVAQTLYLRHDGTNSITNCKFYLFSNLADYTGDFSASADLNELLLWGNQATSDAFGGLLINQDAVNSFVASWPTYLSKGTISSLTTVIRDSVGSDSATGINLHVNSGATSTGTLQTGTSPNVRIQLKVAIPLLVSSIGKRSFALKMRYTYTS